MIFSTMEKERLNLTTRVLLNNGGGVGDEVPTVPLFNARQTLLVNSQMDPEQRVNAFVLTL